MSIARKKKKKHTINSQPLIQILSLRKFHSLPQAPAPKRCLRKLSQLVTARALGRRARLERGSRPRIAGRCQSTRIILERANGRW